MKTFLCLISLCLLLTGCGEKIEPGHSEQGLKEKVAVSLLTLQAVKETSSETFVGSIESIDRALIVSRSSGLVTQLAVREGDSITPGQSLLIISDDPAEDQLMVAEASVNSAKNQQATALARLTLAKQTAQRYDQLWAKQVVTAQEYDQIKAELEVAKQQAAMSDSEVKRAAAGRAAALRQSQFSRISAPFAGRIVSLQIKPGSTVLPGTPLLTIDSAGNRQARIQIPERLRNSISIGIPMLIDVPSLQQRFAAQVTQVQPSSDSQSRTFEALLSLPNSQGLPSGVFVRARHAQPAEDVLLIPDTAVSIRGQLTGVFLERDGVLHFRLVRLGRSFGTQWEVLSGVQSGDRIVSENIDRAFDGARVES